MADIKFSQAVAAQALTDADILLLTQNVGGTLESRRATLAEVKAHVAGSSSAPVVTQSGTSLLATGANSGNYTRFTNSGTKTYTFDSTQTYVVGAEYHGRNAGAGALTLSQAGTFVINAPAGGTLVVPVGGTFTVKIVAAAEADLFGVTVSA